MLDHKPSPRTRVAVLGAGLQGSCVALDLAAGGIDVDLYDRNPMPMMEASLHNEGKVHLGYVYANDRTLRTAQTMVEGAATFGPLLERWLEIPMSQLPISSAFNYAVHRDSLVTVEDFEIHLKRTHDVVIDRIRGGQYFGVDVERAPERLSPVELEADYDPEVAAAVFRTEEVGIDPATLAELVRSRISGDPRVLPRFDTKVLSVGHGDERLVVESMSKGKSAAGEYDHVVNALWGGRLAVDVTMGLTPERPWLFRVKHFLVVHWHQGKVPSTTIVLGPFGDILDYGNGTYYFSWYPSGLQGSSSDVEAPERLLSLPPGAEGKIKMGTIRGLSTIIPGVADLPVARFEDAELKGGLIFAWGASDIDDPASGLHDRHAIGPRSVGRYHTIDTGKLSTAPLYARMVGNRIRAGS